MQRILASFVLLLLCLIFPAAAPAAAKDKDTLAPAAKPETDAGAKDPADFPRAPGLVRRSYSEDPGKIYSTEIATYHAQAGMDEVAAHYLKQLPAASWNKVSDSTSGADVHRLRMIEWHSPRKEAEVRFYAAKGGGSDLRVRIFTYKAAPPAKPVTVPVAAPAVQTKADVANAGPATASATQAAAVGATAKSNATGAAKLGPPPTNITITAQNVWAHTISWFKPGNCSNFDVMREDPDGWVTIKQGTPETSVHEGVLTKPNTRYRVVAHYLDGSVGSADYVWANPPQIQVTVSPPAQGNRDSLIIINHNLETWQWGIRLVPPPGVAIGAGGTPIVLEWGQNRAIVQLSNMPPVDAFDGTLELSPPPDLSDTNSPVIRLPFRWVPRYETQVITLEETYLNPPTSDLPENLAHLIASTDSHLTGPGLQSSLSYVKYDFFFLLGGRGDDEFFTQTLLDPVWKVQSVEITSKAYLGKGEAKIVDSRVGTNSPYVKVHWWADLQSSLTYSIRITVKGPSGSQPLKWKVLPDR